MALRPCDDTSTPVPRDSSARRNAQRQCCRQWQGYRKGWSLHYASQYCRNLEPTKPNALLPIESATVHWRQNTKEKRTAATLNPLAFQSRVAALPENLKTVHEKAFPFNESTIGELLSAQILRTKTFSLSVKDMFFSALRLLSHELSARGGSLAARARNRSQRLAGVVEISVFFVKTSKALFSSLRNSPRTACGTLFAHTERPLFSSLSGTYPAF